MRNRAWRRAQRDRRKAAAKAVLILQGAYREPFRSETDAELAIRAARQATTPHPCSGPCCGNPRHWFEGQDRLTMQERRAFQPDE